MTQRFSVIEAPSILGLRPSGVERLPDVLKRAGLAERLQAENGGRVEPLPYSDARDASTLVLNPDAIRKYSLRLAGRVSSVIATGRFPVVLGGDCSILIGCMLALRRAGRYGLLFLDGHADFYQPEAEPTGEVASMDLAIVSGRGPGVLADIDGLKPLVADEDIVAFGYRDAEQQREYGSQDLRDTGIHAMDLEVVRKAGIIPAISHALGQLQKPGIEGFWIHLDADVLNDAIMPAVDYRLPDGLTWDELKTALRTAMASGRAVGITITILNPSLDSDGSIAVGLARSIVDGLSGE